MNTNSKSQPERRRIRPILTLLTVLVGVAMAPVLTTQYRIVSFLRLVDYVPPVAGTSYPDLVDSVAMIRDAGLVDAVLPELLRRLRTSTGTVRVNTWHAIRLLENDARPAIPELRLIANDSSLPDHMRSDIDELILTIQDPSRAYRGCD